MKMERKSFIFYSQKKKTVNDTNPIKSYLYLLYVYQYLILAQKFFLLSAEYWPFHYIISNSRPALTHTNYRLAAFDSLAFRQRDTSSSDRYYLIIIVVANSRRRMLAETKSISRRDWRETDCFRCKERRRRDLDRYNRKQHRKRKRKVLDRVLHFNKFIINLYAFESLITRFTWIQT